MSPASVQAVRAQTLALIVVATTWSCEIDSKPGAQTSAQTKPEERTVQLKQTHQSLPVHSKDLRRNWETHSRMYTALDADWDELTNELRFTAAQELFEQSYRLLEQLRPGDERAEALHEILSDSLTAMRSQICSDTQYQQFIEAERRFEALSTNSST